MEVDWSVLADMLQKFQKELEKVQVTYETLSQQMQDHKSLTPTSAHLGVLSFEEQKFIPFRDALRVMEPDVHNCNNVLYDYIKKNFDGMAAALNTMADALVTTDGQSNSNEDRLDTLEANFATLLARFNSMNSILTTKASLLTTDYTVRGPYTAVTTAPIVIAMTGTQVRVVFVVDLTTGAANTYFITITVASSTEAVVLGDAVLGTVVTPTLLTFPANPSARTFIALRHTFASSGTRSVSYTMTVPANVNATIKAIEVSERFGGV